jgi:hypothetical protein
MPEPGTRIPISMKRIYTLQLTEDDIAVINRGLIRQPWEEANPILVKMGKQLREQDEQVEKIKQAAQHRVESEDSADKAEKELLRIARESEKGGKKK